MSTLARDARIALFGTKSLLILGALFIALLALFFIPEFIDFQKRFSQTGEEEGDLSVVTTKDEEEAKVTERSPTKEESEESVMRRDIPAPPQDPSVTVPKTKPIPITWEAIRQGEGDRALKKAYDEILTLAKTIGPGRPNTQYALYKLASGIRFVQEGAERVMSAQEGHRYLEDLSSGVTEAMRAERVERADRVVWSRISLGPVFETSRALREREWYVPPFNPRLMLSNLQVFAPLDESGKTDFYMPQLIAEFTVRGRDIDRVEVYHDKKFIRPLSLSAPDYLGRQTVFFGIEDAQGVYTLVVYGINGETWEKSYTFYPRVKVYPWEHGDFLVPRITGENQAQMDAYFKRRGYYLNQPLTASGRFFSGDGLAKF